MLVLHYHPFASYCQKVLVALYELELPFERKLIEDDADRAALRELWPLGGMPVLVDDEAGKVVPESSIVMEYLDTFVAPEPRLLTGDVLAVRRWDRFFDLYVETPMQKI